MPRSALVDNVTCSFYFIRAKKTWFFSPDKKQELKDREADLDRREKEVKQREDELFEKQKKVNQEKKQLENDKKLGQVNPTFTADEDSAKKVE